MGTLPAYQRLLYRFFYLIGATAVARFWNRGKVMILCYHGITERLGADPKDRSSIAVNQVVFLAQLRHLTRHYHVITLRDYLASRTNQEKLPLHSVVLTFDDGMRNFLSVAAPILNELRLSATVFLITEKVNGRRDLKGELTWAPSDDHDFLSWQDVRALMENQAIDFGSHTCTHAKLTELSREDIRRELQSSLNTMRQNLKGAVVSILAYPYGEYSPAIAEIARSSGYLSAVTTEAGSNSPQIDLHELRRAVIHRDDTLAVFAARVSGLTGWLRFISDFVYRLIPRRAAGLRFLRKNSAAQADEPI
jgi:peptidoglycan/xylan/chitin deacetylase (PgdA/CDA1 family)